MNKKKWAALAAGVVILALSYLLTPPEPMVRESLVGIGVLVATVLIFSVGIIPDWACIMTMFCGWIVLCGVPVGTVCGSFSTSTWWLLVGSCILGYGMVKSGLGIRIALLIVKKLPANFFGISMTLFISGFIINPFIPSTTTKGVMGAPITRSIGRALGYADGSKELAGIFLAYFTGFTVLSPAFVSGSFISYSMLAMYEGGAEVTFLKWIAYTFPWTIVVSVLMMVALMKMYRPKVETKILKSEMNAKYDELGPISRVEICTGCVLTGCLIGWIIEPITGISAGVVAMLGAILLGAFGVCNAGDIKQAPWGTLLFCGGLMAIGNVFTALKISDFFTVVLGPIMTPFMSNPWIFVPMLCIIMYVGKFFVTPFAGLVPLAMTVLLPLCAVSGLNPFVAGFTAYTCVNIWITEYQNNVMLSAKAAFGGGDLLGPHGQLIPLTLAFMVINIIACMACIPVWSWFGLLV